MKITKQAKNIRGYIITCIKNYPKSERFKGSLFLHIIISKEEFDTWFTNNAGKAINI